MLAYKEGSYKAFEVLYARQSPRVFSYLSQRLSETARVHDVFQDVFMRLHKYRGKYELSFPFIPWLYTLAQSALIDEFRRNSKKVLYEQFDEEINYVPSEADNDTVERIDLNEAVLSSAEREVLSLRYLQDLPFSEIAKKLGLKPDNTRKIASRALQKLRTLLGK